uniref:DnaJ homolog subfamily C member 2 n=1 Tax=Mesocestoides corti TaxID=53468 RepID=A0A5K3F3D3_MESCO
MVGLVVLALVCLLGQPFGSQAWVQADLEMFDLIEELDKNFYEFLNVPNTALASDIKRAYRKLSLEMHPDKNVNDPDAHVKFRQLSVIYQILKDKDRRERYDDVLENGMPDWKTPVFYYRKLRKMSNLEIGLLSSILVITIHFATLWGLTFERRWNLRERLENHMKRHKASEKRKVAIDIEIAEQLKAIPWPNFLDILPIALVRGIFSFILSVPTLCRELRQTLFHSVEQVIKERQELKEIKKMQSERLQKRGQKKRHTVETGGRQQNPVAEFDELTPSVYQISNLVSTCEEVSEKEPEGTEQPWTADDELLLVRLANKYPGGYPNRWKKIAEMLGRTVSDVTSKAATIASDLSSRSLLSPSVDESSGEESDEDDYYLSKRKAKRAGKPLPKSESQPEPSQEPLDQHVVDDAGEEADDDDDSGDVYVSRKKQKQSAKTAATSNTNSPEVPGSTGWSQKEQNQLETAISAIPKGTPERWHLIAECVPSKTPSEIFARVKYLSETSKKKFHSID